MPGRVTQRRIVPISDAQETASYKIPTGSHTVSTARSVDGRIVVEDR